MTRVVLVFMSLCASLFAMRAWATCAHTCLNATCDSVGVASCRELEDGSAAFMMGTACPCSKCECTTPDVVARLSRCDALRVETTWPATLSCVEVKLAEALDLSVEAVVERAVVRGSGLTIRAAPSSRVMRIAAGGSLELEDVVLTGGFAHQIGGGCVLVERNATLTTKNVEMTNCSTTTIGGAILAWTASSVFLDCGTRISRSLASFRGGGMAAFGATVEIRTGASIEGCMALYQGGCVFVGPRTVLVLAGLIKNCTAIDYGGGGIAALSDGPLSMATLYMTPGSRIEQSTGALYGGGMLLDFADVRMEGTTVATCTAGFGAAILALSHVIIAATDSTSIEQCMARVAAGAIFTLGTAVVVFESSQIANCTSNDIAGGVFMWRGTSLDLLGLSRIDRCWARVQGGGIFSHGGIMTFDGGSIGHCSSMFGGAIYAQPNAVVKLHNAAVYDSLSEVNGGGLYIEQSSQVFMTGTRCFGNLALNGACAYMTSDVTLHASTSVFEANFALSAGGGVYSKGLVVLAGSLSVIGNVGGTGAGMLMYGDTARLVMSSAKCGFVHVEIDATASSNGGPDRPFVSVSTVDSDGLRHPYDARSALAVVEWLPGDVVKRDFCFPRGIEIEVRLVSPTSAGWEGATLSYMTYADSSMPNVVDLTVRSGAHSLVSSTIMPPGPQEDDGIIRFVSNVVVSDGGALVLSDGSIAIGAFVYFANNVAANDGGAIFIDSMSHLDASHFEFYNQTSEGDGGAIYSSILSVVHLNDTVAVRNLATSGGFAAFDTTEEVAIDGLLAINNRARGFGGAIKFAHCRTAVILGSTFDTNGASENGGAIFLTDSMDLSVVGGHFIGNAAGDSGGAIATDSDTRLLFDVDACVLVHFLVDFANTTKPCIPPKGHDSTLDDRTCDFFPQGCTIHDNDPSGPGRSACDGCACWYAVERYASIADRHGNNVGIVTGYADAMKTTAICLEPDEQHHFEAVDVFGSSWWGGTIQMLAPDGTFLTPRVTVDGNRSRRVGFTTPATDSNVANRNIAAGGGGVLYWVDVEPSGTIDGTNNIAAYGSTIASPPVEIRHAGFGSNGTYEASSGRRLAHPVTVELVDVYGEVVTLAKATAATIRHSYDAENVTMINNIAEFEPRAKFDQFVVFAKPGSTVLATVESTIPSLKHESIDVAFRIRSCETNEYEYNYECIMCPVGSFLAPRQDGGTQCVNCHSSMICRKPGNELATLELKAGYFRTTHTSREIYNCRHKAACPEGDAVGTPQSCRVGHRGLLCAACDSGYFMNINARCTTCSSSIKRAGFGVYSLLVFSLLLYLIWLFTSNQAAIMLHRMSDANNGSSDIVKLVQLNRLRNDSTCSDLNSIRDKNDSFVDDVDGETDRTNRREDWVSRCVVKIKAILTMAQVIGSLPFVTDVKFPDGYRSILRVAGLANLSFESVLPTSCLFPAHASSSYIRAYFGLTLAPIVLAFTLYMAYRVRVLCMRPERRGSSRRRLRFLCTEMMLLVLHLALPATSTAAFLALVCKKFDYGNSADRSYMRVALTVSCTSRLWTKIIRPYSIVMIFVYPTFVPMLYALLLWRCRYVLNPVEEVTKNSDLRGVMQHSPSMRNTVVQSMVFQKRLDEWRRGHLHKADDFYEASAFRWLYIDYQCKYYWFEVFELTRRISLSACLALVAPDRPLQLAVGFFVAMAFCAFTMMMRPFYHSDDNVLAIGAQLCTATTLYIAFLLRTKVLTIELAEVTLILVAFIPLILIMYPLRTFCCRLKAFTWWKAGAVTPNTGVGASDVDVAIEDDSDDHVTALGQDGDSSGHSKKNNRKVAFTDAVFDEDEPPFDLASTTTIPDSGSSGISSS